MDIVLEKIPELSGLGASIYSFREIGSFKSRFESFLEDNDAFSDELKSIVSRLVTIGQRLGADEQFFKLNEGIPGDGVCALYDLPEKHLRLYCIRFGRIILIIGEGGEKPKNVRSLQENDTFKKENYLLRKLSATLSKMIREKDIVFNDDYTDFRSASNILIKLDDDGQ